MRIARIACMYYPFPPPEYGGTERSMSQMTYFQAMRGHDVTLYGPANSTIVAETADVAAKYGFHAETAPDASHVALYEHGQKRGSVRLATTGYDDTTSTGDCVITRNAELLDLLLDDARAGRHDLIHCHEPALMPRIMTAGFGDMTICQLHNRELNDDYRARPYPLIAISHHHALDIKIRYQAEILGVAHHGLDRFNHDANYEHAGYLTSVGRFARDKGQDLAIAAARTAGKPLVIAGVAGGTLRNDFYFMTSIHPHVDVHDPDFTVRHAASPAMAIRAEIDELCARLGKPDPVIFVGPVNEAQKQVLYGNALATLFPIRWQEPFGRVMIESMACGTPVIANEEIDGLICGAVSEVVDEGLSGFKIVAENDADAVTKIAAAVARAETLDRSRVRETFEERWTGEANARRLDALYDQFLPEQLETELMPLQGYRMPSMSAPAVA